MDGIPPPASPVPPPPPPPLTPPPVHATPDFTLPRFPGDKILRLVWKEPFWAGKIPINKVYIVVIAAGVVALLIIALIGICALCKTRIDKFRYD